jgi:hypothetical protein
MRAVEQLTRSAFMGSPLFPAGRERHDKRRPLSQLTFGRDLAAVAFDDLLTDGQPHAHTFIFTPSMKPLKRGKYPIKVFLVETDAVVFHEDAVGIDSSASLNRTGVDLYQRSSIPSMKLHAIAD